MIRPSTDSPEFANAIARAALELDRSERLSAFDIHCMAAGIRAVASRHSSDRSRYRLAASLALSCEPDNPVRAACLLPFLFEAAGETIRGQPLTCMDFSNRYDDRRLICEWTRRVMTCVRDYVLGPDHRRHDRREVRDTPAYELTPGPSPDAAARDALDSVERLASPAQKRALHRLAAGETLTGADRNALHQFRRRRRAI